MRRILKILMALFGGGGNGGWWCRCCRTYASTLLMLYVLLSLFFNLICFFSGPSMYLLRPTCPAPPLSYPVSFSKRDSPPPCYGARLHVYRENSSASSSLDDSRPIVHTHAAIGAIFYHSLIFCTRKKPLGGTHAHALEL